MRALIVMLAVALAAVHFRLWVTSGGMREVWRLEQQVETRTDENRKLTDRNSALAAEVRDLKTGLAAAEERARSELGMVLESESFYQIVPHGAAAGLRHERGEDRSGSENDTHDNGSVPGRLATAPSTAPQQHVDRSAAAMAPVR